MIGIVLTVAAVECFFERRRLQKQGKQLAFDALQHLEHAVSVWQGGPPARSMDSDAGWTAILARYVAAAKGGERIGR